MVSVLEIVIVVWGIYFIFGYLDSKGECMNSSFGTEFKILSQSSTLEFQMSSSTYDLNYRKFKGVTPSNARATTTTLESNKLEHGCRRMFAGVSHFCGLSK